MGTSLYNVHNSYNIHTSEYYSRRKTIAFGDRIFVRVTAHGETRLEMSTEMVADYTQLVGEIRNRLHGFSGLTKVWIRNHSRGWSEERPLMFYAPARNPSVCISNHTTAPRKRMLAPWETH